MVVLKKENLFVAILKTHLKANTVRYYQSRTTVDIWQRVLSCNSKIFVLQALTRDRTRSIRPNKSCFGHRRTSPDSLMPRTFFVLILFLFRFFTVTRYLSMHIYNLQLFTRGFSTLRCIFEMLIQWLKKEDLIFWKCTSMW